MSERSTDRRGDPGQRGAGDPDPEDEPDDEGAVLREYRRVMYSFTFIGIEFGVAVALGYFGGNWLDQQWGTSPWMMLLGVAIGLTAASKDLLRLIRRAKRAGQPKPPPNDDVA